MKSIGLLAVFGLLLAGCANIPPRFENMSDAELLAYNSSVPIMDQVICRMEVQIGSHIRRRICTSVRDIVYGTIGTLDTPSSSTSIPYNSL